MREPAETTLRLPLLATLLGLAAFGCGQSNRLPGHSIGDYEVEANLVATSCGAGHPAPETLAFTMELREQIDTTRRYWRLPEGRVIEGTYQDAVLRFEDSAQFPVRAMDTSVDCILIRQEVVELREEGWSIADGGQMLTDADLTLSPDAGVPPVAGDNDLSGTTTVRIWGATGTDCSPLLTSAGGEFPALPCTISYSLGANRKSEAP